MKQRRGKPIAKAATAADDSGESDSFWEGQTSAASDDDRRRPAAAAAPGTEANLPQPLSQSKSNDDILGVAAAPADFSKILPAKFVSKKGSWDDVAIRAVAGFSLLGLFLGLIWAGATLLALRIKLVPSKSSRQALACLPASCCAVTGHVASMALVLLLQCAIFNELSALRFDIDKERKLPYLTTRMRWYFFVVVILYGHGIALRPQWRQLASSLDVSQELINAHEFVCYFLYSLGFVVFVTTLRKGSFRYQFGVFAWTHMVLFLVVMQATTMISNIFRGLIWFLLPAGLVIGNDTSAYFAGRAFGRTPLIRLSPKKTLEGFVGATAFTMVLAFYFSDYLSDFSHLVCPKETLDLQAVRCDIPLVFVRRAYILPPQLASLTSFSFVNLKPVQLHSLVLALFCSIIAPFGGFFASGLKRALKKKDFGDLIPGHGGITDRFDCQFLMAAFSYIYVRTFLTQSTVTLARVMNQATQLSREHQQELLEWLSSQLAGTAAPTA